MPIFCRTLTYFSVVQLGIAMKHIVGFTFLSFIVSGCMIDRNPGVYVTPQSVHSYADFCSSPVENVTPAGYVFAGFDYVDQECQTFFDNIVELQKDARYASSSVSNACTK
jgi:hypothetical protein